MKNIAIVYPFFAIYRFPILKVLAKDKDINYFFISDVNSSDGIKVIDFKSEQHFEKKFYRVKNVSFGKILWQSGVISILLKKKFDAVIFLGEDRTLSTWIAMFILKMKKVNVYLWTHGIYGNENLIKRKIRILFNNVSDGIFLYNNRAKNILLKENVTERKLNVIYNSLDYDLTEKYRKEYNFQKRNEITKVFLNPSLPVVFCISRLTANKKIELLLDALKILNSQGYKLNCFIIGDGSQRDILSDKILNNNLQGEVHIVGEIYNEKEISEYIMSSELCVCPGPIGLTAIHSLSYGVPVISNDYLKYQGPESEAIIPGITGDLYSNGDVTDLAVKIRSCIETRLLNIEKSKTECLSIIHNYYNPQFQSNVLKQVLLS